ncbi:MAPEG family protein [Vibrio sonorensis]|uniref:MAPEG family protein n=1 Tax=Vibrio sonorensis TaxID=1004316 RepID=UPI0008D9926E|nr:MAPEG family protein [Vibrio sonorensis]
MVTALYAVVLAGLLLFLAIQVIFQRRKAKVKYSDGGVEALAIARSAHGNAVDYIPIVLILMALVEYNGAPLWFVHLIGGLFVISRVMHARAILNERLSYRVKSMKLTFTCLVTLMVANVFFLPWGYLW